jgi:DNA primase small subunit
MAGQSVEEGDAPACHPPADAGVSAEPELQSSAAPVPMARGDLGSQLKWYYARLFPADLFTRWLSYGDLSYLARREISMTLPGDIYLRWKSFATADALLVALKQMTPVKIDLGAVYNFPPKDKNAIPTPLVPQEKEFCLDIDMTDYDDVIGNLAGGSEVDVCDRNWRYMSTAVRVLDAALREDFGFSLILWVYSGRRGIHCWVADQRARRLTNEQRVAIADFLYLRFEGRENSGRKQSEVTVPLHPSLARAKRIACDATFREFVLGDQGMLDTADRVEAVIAVIPSEAVRLSLRGKLLGDGVAARASAADKWERIEKEVLKAGQTDWNMKGVADYVMFKHTYPRLDVNVSKEINHLLKAPFCVHPKTGRVCVPFRVADAEAFRPGERAPLIGTLLGEMEQPGDAMARMRDAVSVFEEFVQDVEVDCRQRARSKNLSTLDRKNALDMLAD